MGWSSDWVPLRMTVGHHFAQCVVSCRELSSECQAGWHIIFLLAEYI